MGGTALAFYGLGVTALATSLVKLKQRLELSKAKHRSLAGHAGCRGGGLGGAVLRIRPEPVLLLGRRTRGVATRRRDGFMRLSALYETRFAKTIESTAASPTASPICNSPKATACRTSTAVRGASICGSRLRAVLGGRDRHGS